MIEIDVTRDLEACHLLRRIVFIEEQGVSEADELDDLDDGAIHLLARDQGRPVASARLLLQGEVGKIGRVCVLKEMRGTGLGQLLMLKALEELSRLPEITTAKLGAQCHALGFYEKLGFTAFGPIYDDAGIPHRDMKIVLKKA